MNKDNKFILTTSKKSAEELITLGYTLISNSDEKWIFINNGKSLFNDGINIIYTDKLFI